MTPRHELLAVVERRTEFFLLALAFLMIPVLVGPFFGDLPPAKSIAVVLDDEALYSAVEEQADASGRSLEEIVVRAIRYWLEDAEVDDQGRADITAAHREWKERGGMEAHEFFEKLRKEETSG